MRLKGQGAPNAIDIPPPPSLSLLTASASAYSHACPLVGSTLPPEYRPADLLPHFGS